MHRDVIHAQPNRLHHVLALAANRVPGVCLSLKIERVAFRLTSVQLPPAARSVIHASCPKIVNTVNQELSALAVSPVRTVRTSALDGLQAHGRQNAFSVHLAKNQQRTAQDAGPANLTISRCSARNVSHVPQLR